MQRVRKNGPVAVVLVLGLLRASPAESEVKSKCQRLDRSSNELTLSAIKGQAKAIVFGAVPPTDGSRLKVVARLTGEGRLRVSVWDPSGRPSHLDQVPDRHSGASSFNAPGDEWGLFLRFSGAGCWRIQLDRIGTSATAIIEVLPSITTTSSHRTVR
jgi:hypothetical protein